MNSSSEKKPVETAPDQRPTQPGQFTQQLVRFYPIIFFLVCFVAVWIWRAIATGSPQHDAFVILAATIATLLVVNQRLPIQNIIGLVVTFGVFWWATLLIAKISGAFFTPPHFNFHFLRDYEFGLLWIVGLINARGIGQLALFGLRKTTNYGLWLIALSGLLVLIEDFAARKSLIYSVGKFLFVVVAFIAATPWWIDKKRIEQKREYQPLLITLLLWLW